MNELIDTMNRLCDEEEFDVTWHVTDLATGSTADRNGDVTWPSASTRKVAIMMTAFAQAHEGALSLDQRMSPDPVYEENIAVTEGTGCLQYLQRGYELTLLDYLTLMIVLSDNISRSVVIDAVSLDAINDYSRGIGMTSSLQGENNPDRIKAWDSPEYVQNVTTSNDQGRLLRMMVAGAQSDAEAARLGVTSERCVQALEIMKAQQLNLALPYLLPPQARVAHKTGAGRRLYTDYGPVYHAASDIGVVYDRLEPRYILAAYCDHVPEIMPDGRAGQAAAQMLMAKLSRACWDRLVA